MGTDIANATRAWTQPICDEVAWTLDVTLSKTCNLVLFQTDVLQNSHTSWILILLYRVRELFFLIMCLLSQTWKALRTPEGEGLNDLITHRKVQQCHSCFGTCLFLEVLHSHGIEHKKYKLLVSGWKPKPPSLLHYRVCTLRTPKQVLLLASDFTGIPEMGLTRVFAGNRSKLRSLLTRASARELHFTRWIVFSNWVSILLCEYFLYS